MRSYAKRLRPSPAMVVAVIALVAGVVGTAIALPGKNMIDKNDLRRAVVKKKNLVPAVRKQLVLPGVQAALRNGAAKGYALVNANGTVAEGFRVTSAHVTQPKTGVYCFNLPFNPRSVQATVEGIGSRLVLAPSGPGRDYIISARARPDAGGGSGFSLRSPNCPGTESASVEIQDPKTQEDVGGAGDASYAVDPVNVAFYVEFK